LWREEARTTSTADDSISAKRRSASNGGFLVVHSVFILPSLSAFPLSQACQPDFEKHPDGVTISDRLDSTLGVDGDRMVSARIDDLASP